MREIILITIAGPDRPGISAHITGLLADHDVNILDISQAVIHDHLSLGMLIETPSEQESALLMKAVLFAAHEMGLTARFRPITTESYQQWVAGHGKARYIVTLLARKITAEHIAAVSGLVAANDLNIDGLSRLSGRVPLESETGVPRDTRKACVEFSVRGEPRDISGMRAAFLRLANELNLDIAFQQDNAFRRNRRVVCFDMDSTLIEHEVIDELAKAAGVGDKVAAITERAMNGELDFTQSFRARVSLLKGLDASVLEGLRPVFCYWGWVCAGGSPDAPGPADDLGAAFELLHAFALVHDDVMDDAALRRGHPTTHVAFAEIHRDQGLRGDDRLFGEGVAILVGDLAHVYAGSIVATMPPATRTRWRTMQLELMAGQYLDLWCAAHGEADARRSKLIARLKSGRYTIEQPLLLGASLLTEGVDPGPSAVDDALVAYGEPLGMAFQLRDDLLGAVGDPAVTGKPVGDDLRTGKPTLLLVSALERADDAQRATLARVGHPDLGDDEVAELQAVMAETGALDAVEEEITALSAASRAALDVEVIPASARSALNDLVDLVSFRSS